MAPGSCAARHSFPQINLAPIKTEPTGCRGRDGAGEGAEFLSLSVLPLWVACESVFILQLQLGVAGALAICLFESFLPLKP